MRTTLTLEPDVFQRLEQRTRAARITFKQAVNDTLRAGLKLTAAKKNPPVRIHVHSSKLAPGIDPDANLNHLADDWEAEEWIGKLQAA